MCSQLMILILGIKCMAAIREVPKVIWTGYRQSWVTTDECKTLIEGL